MQPEPLDGIGFVGDGAMIRGVQRLDQQPIAEHLWRLRLPQAVARLRAQHPPFDVRLLQGVGYRDRKQSPGLIRRELAHQAFELARPEARPRRVVHQHPIGCPDRVVGSEQTVEHARRPRFASAVEGLELGLELPPVELREIRVAGGQHHEHLLDQRRRAQAPQRVIKERMARKWEILLRPFPAHAGAPASRGNDRKELRHTRPIWILAHCSSIISGLRAAWRRRAPPGL